jgi:SAM-dependent methyltransferase
MRVRHEYAYGVVRALAQPTDRLLEVGFGEGYGTTFMSDAVESYTGLEVSQEAVEHAEAKYGRKNVSFHWYDGLRFPLDEARFDLVFSLQVIEHVEDVDAYLSEMCRVCRSGGLIVIVTPNRLGRLGEGERPWNRYHRVEFSPAELESVLSRHFADVDLVGIVGSPLVHELERRRIARMRRLARLDPLRLRYRLPERVASSIASALKRAGRAKPVEVAAITASDFSHSTQDVATALDLLAVVRR